MIKKSTGISTFLVSLIYLSIRFTSLIMDRKRKLEHVDSDSDIPFVGNRYYNRFTYTGSKKDLSVLQFMN